MKKILSALAICILCVSCTSNSNDHAKGHDKTESQPSDWEITASVKKKIMTDSSLSSSARMVSVTTNDGVVTLTGTVATREESRKVESLVKRVSGVRSVENQLTVSNPNA